MALFLEITDGPDKGQRYRITDGVQIGRTQGQIRVKDTKTSGLHAQVEEDGKGQLILVDKDSFNGLRINGQKVKRIALLHGVNFQIGKNYYRVLKLFAEDTDFREEIAETDWRERLTLAIEKTRISPNSLADKVGAFPNAVELRFIEGIQTDQSYTLGYGPRRIGSQSLDIELEEPNSPAFAFEIEPSGSDIIFKTDCSDQVLLNGVSTPTQILSSGDRIYIGNSVIEVRFIL